MDRIGGERRPRSLSDVATAARFCDGLKYIGLVGAMADPPEIPGSYRPIEVMATLIKNTTKPIRLCLPPRMFCSLQ